MIRAVLLSLFLTSCVATPVEPPPYEAQICRSGTPEAYRCVLRVAL